MLVLNAPKALNLLSSSPSPPLSPRQLWREGFAETQYWTNSRFLDNVDRISSASDVFDKNTLLQNIFSRFLDNYFTTLSRVSFLSACISLARRRGWWLVNSRKAKLWFFVFCKKNRGHLAAAGHYVNFHHIGRHKWDRGLGQTFLGQSWNSGTTAQQP